MDLPVSDLVPIKESAPAFPCPHSDTELVHKIAQLLLPGLATACVDSTTGGLFKSPSTVAVDLRKEFVDYLTQRSETYIAEMLMQPRSDDGTNPDPNEPNLDDPAEIVSDLIEDFASSKRNFFSRVSSWLLSDSREDKIDDFVQEMEMNGFWLIDRRESVAEILLKNLDFKNLSHCSMRFEDIKQLEDHKRECSFRPVSCSNDGCKVKYCKVHEEKHDSSCPYKVLPCEQKCEARIVRREMDRHCITVCRMKLLNCPFYQVGCQSAFPQCGLKEHCSEFLKSHLVCVLQVVHKNEEELEEDELKERAELMEKSQFRNELAEALDVRSLTLEVKEVEAKMKKLEHDLHGDGYQSEQAGDQA